MLSGDLETSSVGSRRSLGSNKTPTSRSSTPYPPPPNIPVLKSFMSEKLSEIVIEKVDMKEVQALVLLLLQSSLQVKSPSIDDALIVESVMLIWISLTNHEPSLISLFLSNSSVTFDANKISLLAIFYSSNDKERELFSASIRSSYVSAVEKLCQNSENGLAFFLNLLIKNIPSSVSDPAAKHCNQFFNLFSNLLSFNSAIKYVDIKGIFDSTVSAIEKHPIVENTDMDQDFLLVGLMKLACTILEKFVTSVKTSLKEDFITRIFSDCLFASSEGVINVNVVRRGLPPKCKNPKSRAVAFKLLSLLVKNTTHGVKKLLAPKFGEMKNSMIAGKNFDLVPSSSDNEVPNFRTDNAHVGLRNLGNICYMNRYIILFNALSPITIIHSFPPSCVLFPLFSLPISLIYINILIQTIVLHNNYL